MRLHCHSEIHLWWVKSLRGEICPWQVKSSLREGDGLISIQVLIRWYTVGRAACPPPWLRIITRSRPRYIRNNGGAQGPALQLISRTVPYLSFNTLGFAPLVSPAGSVASGENDYQSFSNTLGFASLPAVASHYNATSTKIYTKQRRGSSPRPTITP